MTRRRDQARRWWPLLVVPMEAAVIAALLAGAAVPTALRVVVGLAALTAVGYELREYRRRYLRRRSAGMGRRKASTAAIGDVLPAPVVSAAQMEWAIWQGLVRGVLRCPLVPDGAVPFGHHRTLAPVRWIGVAVLVVEVGVVHLVVPAGAVRIVLLIVGLYSLVWIVGYLLGAGPVRPHLVSAESVVLRTGLTTDVTVPTRLVRTARVHRQSRPGMATVQLEGSVLHVVDNGGTNLHLTLGAALPVTLARGRTGDVTDIRIWVDDPHDMAGAIHQVVASVDPSVVGKRPR